MGKESENAKAGRKFQKREQWPLKKRERRKLPFPEAEFIPPYRNPLGRFTKR